MSIPPPAESRSLDRTKFPFNCRAFDPETVDGLRVQELWNNAIHFSQVSSLDYLEVVDDKGAFYEDLNTDEEDTATWIYYSGGFRRLVHSLTQPSFEFLFDQLNIPPKYIEVLVNNNGAYCAFPTFFPERGDSELFHVLIKLPRSVLNASLYYQYSLVSKQIVCVICGNFIPELKTALKQVFLTGTSSTSQFPKAPARDPFLILSTTVSEYVSWMEHERSRYDDTVRHLESKTGMCSITYDDSQRAVAAEYAALLKDLHKCEGNLRNFERTVEFQVRWIEFLRKQQYALNELRLGTFDIKAMNSVDRPGSQRVAASFDLSASFSRERLEQVRTLKSRIQIQLSVVANLIARNDSRTNISVAEASRQIAIETKRDSNAMKTIAALTMIFLPGTFVATLFSMVFFKADSAPDSRFSVDPHWWVYVAVTIPLTIITILVWLGWLRWKEARRVHDEENNLAKQKQY
ncbi:MAG: hypothetical protein M1836_000811 [Candelina mexicana]|nr:MAG: hypothetical protein M1836_000811 [Candelina mexicana]